MAVFTCPDCHIRLPNFQVQEQDVKTEMRQKRCRACGEESKVKENISNLYLLFYTLYYNTITF